MAEEEKNIEAKAAHHHAHHHGVHGHAHDHGASGNIAIAFVINLAFAIFEFVGGFFVNSIAIVSDAVHDLGDALVIGTSLVLEKKSGKAPDSSYSYGYRRYKEKPVRTIRIAWWMKRGKSISRRNVEHYGP